MSDIVRPASFDSSSALVAATARALRGERFGIVGRGRSPLLRAALAGANHLPRRVRQELYALGSGRERQPAAAVARTDSEALARTIVAAYDAPGTPARVPGAVIGSATGSLAHLCTALGMPLLPQTVLVPVRRPGDADEPAADIPACRETAAALLERNPDLVLHQMADPNNDRLTLKYFSYFRLKRTAPGPTYERFLVDRLAPGATIVLAECTYRWPQARVGPRHLFQVGGAGALAPEEYGEGSPRVEALLAACGARRTHWEVPSPDVVAPEAEWGYEPALTAAVEELAERRGWRILRLGFDHPDALSGLVADLYRWWLRARGIEPTRLFVESFLLVEPELVQRTGSVPFWLSFNGEEARSALETYLEGAEPYDEVALTLVSNGVPAAGLVATERWEPLLGRARRLGHFAGVDPRRFPADLGVFARYGDVLEADPHRYDRPRPLSVVELEAFLERSAQHYGVSLS